MVVQDALARGKDLNLGANIESVWACIGGIGSVNGAYVHSVAGRVKKDVGSVVFCSDGGKDIGSNRLILAGST